MRLPLTGLEPASEAADERDAFAIAARRELALEMGEFWREGERSGIGDLVVHCVFHHSIEGACSAVYPGSEFRV